MVKSNKPLIIKSVKSAMHSLLTPLVLTIFKCIVTAHEAVKYISLLHKQLLFLQLIYIDAIIMACTLAT